MRKVVGEASEIEQTEAPSALQYTKLHGCCCCCCCCYRWHRLVVREGRRGGGGALVLPPLALIQQCGVLPTNTPLPAIRHKNGPVQRTCGSSMDIKQ